MEKHEKHQREDKIKTGGIVTDGGLATPYRKPERPHGRLYRFLDNYWYHYKWHTVAALFILMVVVVCTLQMCSREEEGDVNLLLAGAYTFSTEQEGYLPLQSCLGTYVPEDYNGNGRKDVTFTTYSVYSKEEIEAAEARVDENGESLGISVDRYGNSQAYEQFMSYIQSGSATVMFLSPYLFSELSGKGSCLVDLAELTGSVPTGAIATESGGATHYYGVRLGDTTLWRENSAVRNMLSPDTVICLMLPTVISSTNDAAYQHAIAYLKKIIQ